MGSTPDARVPPRRREPEAWLGARLLGVDEGERMLVWCTGGLSMGRLVRYPPPLEIEEHGGVYVLVDDGPPEHWRYDFVPLA